MTSEELDQLWDFGLPDVSEARFREVLTDTGNDLNTRVEVLTQIARARGLQGAFDEGHLTLNEAERAISELSNPPQVVEVRIALERRRLFNSSGEPERAISFLSHAWDRALA